MFSIWIGPRPPALQMECMAANEARHGLTLIASENWIGASRFIHLADVEQDALADPRVWALWRAYPEPQFRSDVLRLWYLTQNPFGVYADSDCIIHSLPENRSKPLFPSIQKYEEALAASFKGAAGVPSELDMEDIQNSTGEWLDVWAIAGNGNTAFFDTWLTDWAARHLEPGWGKGGIAVSLSHGPYDVGVLPSDCFDHFSRSRKQFQLVPPTPKGLLEIL